MSGIRISPAKINVSAEKKIITNLLTDSEYTKQVIHLIDQEIFDIAYCKIIFSWIKEHYTKYKESPALLIKDIYNVKKSKLSPEDSELIADFLSSLSNEYSDSEKLTYNTKYMVDSSLPYISAQSYLKLGEKIQSNAKLGMIEECQTLIQKHKKITEATSGCVNPSDPEFVKKTLLAKETDILFEIPGPLGKMIKMERGRLIAIMAPPKTGKTFMLHELGFLARTNRLKVFETNCEMSDTKVNARDLKRITGLGDESREYIGSVLDCRKNQYNICNNPNRKNKVGLINAVGELPEYANCPKDYIPCSICRDTPEYEFATWFESHYREKLTVDKALKSVRGMGLMYGNDLYRLKAYPKFTATVNDIINDLDMLEYTSNFVPDVLIVDYADVLRSLNPNQEVRHQLDEIYKNLGRIATERNILVLTASQTNRAGAGKKSIGGMDIAEAFSKIAHVDSLAMLQSSPQEKRNGILRVSVGYNRDGDCDAEKQVAVLQNLALGQPFTDSAICGYNQD